MHGLGHTIFLSTAERCCLCNKKEKKKQHTNKPETRYQRISEEKTKQNKQTKKATSISPGNYSDPGYAGYVTTMSASKF